MNSGNKFYLILSAVLIITMLSVASISKEKLISVDNLLISNDTTYKAYLGVDSILILVRPKKDSVKMKPDVSIRAKKARTFMR